MTSVTSIHFRIFLSHIKTMHSQDSDKRHMSSALRLPLPPDVGQKESGLTRLLAEDAGGVMLPLLDPETLARLYRTGPKIRKVPSVGHRLHRDGGGLTIPFCFAGEICTDHTEWGKDENGKRCIRCNDTISLKRRIVHYGFEAASAHRELVKAVDSSDVLNDEQKTLVVTRSHLVSYDIIQSELKASEMPEVKKYSKLYFRNIQNLKQEMAYARGLPRVVLKHLHETYDCCLAILQIRIDIMLKSWLKHQELDDNLLAIEAIHQDMPNRTNPPYLDGIDDFVDDFEEGWLVHEEKEDHKKDREKVTFSLGIWPLLTPIYCALSCRHMTLKREENDIEWYGDMELVDTSFLAFLHVQSLTTAWVPEEIVLMPSLERLFIQPPDPNDREEADGALGDLRQLPEAFEKLQTLSELGLNGQRFLERLPERIAYIDLTVLYLDGCKRLNMTQEMTKIAKMKKLTELGLSGTNIESLPYSIKNLTSLRELDLSNCTSLESIEGIEHLESLTVLVVENCAGLASFPEKLPASLKTLFLAGTPAGHNMTADLEEQLKRQRCVIVGTIGGW